MFGTNPDFTTDFDDFERDVERAEAEIERRRARRAARFYRGDEVQPFDEDTCDKEAA